MRDDYIALLFAAQNPGKVESILTLATKLNWTEAVAKKETQLLNPDILEEKVPKYAAQLKSLHGESHWRNLLAAMADAMIRLGTTPLLDSAVYHSIECKVQLMVGDKDIMTTMEETLAAGREIPNANFAVLPDTKHPINTVRKELLLSLMKDFWHFQ